MRREELNGGGMKTNREGGGARPQGEFMLSGEGTDEKSRFIWVPIDSQKDGQSLSKRFWPILKNKKYKFCCNIIIILNFFCIFSLIFIYLNFSMVWP